MKIKLGFFIFGMFLLPVLASAGVVINEIMYDLEGTDSGREWIEIFNDSDQEIDLSSWKFNDGDGATNHGLNEPPENGGQGVLTLSPGSYAILSGDAVMFLSEHLGYSGTVIDTVMSLGQQEDRTYTLQIINSDSAIVNEVSYTISLGANGDGNSLQRTDDGWIAVTPTPGVQNINQQEEGNDSGEVSDDENISTVVPTKYIPPEDLPQIKVYAGKDKTMIAGASGEFNGEAFGLNNEPIENARYLWNFGDGLTKEGQNVFYFYRYQGEYRVVLNVSSGGYSSSDTMSVEVIPNEIFISEIKTGSDSFIELENKSSIEINISGWIFRCGTQHFIFPQNSFIRPHGYLVISSHSSGLLIHQGKDIVELLYPGSFFADSFGYNGILSEGQSFSRSGEDSIVTPETPGRKNESPVVVIQYQKTQEYNQEKVAETKDKPVQQSSSEASDIETSIPSGAEANIIATVGDNSNKSRKNFYIILVLGLAVMSSLGVFLIRRQREI